MTGSSELKRLWRRYREYRVTKKQRSRLASSASPDLESKAGMALDEATATVVGLGLDIKPAEEFIEYALHDNDPRFINNPHGIGCSRTYEEPYDSAANSSSTPLASTRPLVPQATNAGPSDELLSFPKWGVWKAESIDVVKGKRKGRISGDSPDNRLKSLFDGSTSLAKSSAKRFTLVRQRNQTQ